MRLLLCSSRVQWQRAISAHVKTIATVPCIDASSSFTISPISQTFTWPKPLTIQWAALSNCDVHATKGRATCMRHATHAPVQQHVRMANIDGNSGPVYMDYISQQKPSTKSFVEFLLFPMHTHPFRNVGKGIPLSLSLLPHRSWVRRYVHLETHNLSKKWTLTPRYVVLARLYHSYKTRNFAYPNHCPT